MTDRDPLYRRDRFPAEIIVHAVSLYFRLPLSLRMVEDMLAAPSIIVSHQTVRLWAEKFGGAFANDIRSIRGKKRRLWRAVDQDSFVLDVLVQSRRNAKAARASPAIDESILMRRHTLKLIQHPQRRGG